MPGGVALLDADRNIIECNERLGEILGYTVEDIKNKKFSQRKYFHSNGTPMQSEEFPSFVAVKEQRAVRNIEIGVQKEDGSIIWTNVSAAPMPPDTGAHCIVLTIDITRHKNLEEDLKNKNIELEKVNHFMTGRELKMIELKKQVVELENSLKNNQ